MKYCKAVDWNTSQMGIWVLVWLMLCAFGHDKLKKWFKIGGKMPASELFVLKCYWHLMHLSFTDLEAGFDF